MSDYKKNGQYIKGKAEGESWLSGGHATKPTPAPSFGGKQTLVKLVVALPEDQAVRLLAATRLYYGQSLDAQASRKIPLYGKYVNQIVLYGIDQVFVQLENKYAFSDYWKGTKELANKEIRGVI